MLWRRKWLTIQSVEKVGSNAVVGRIPVHGIDVGVLSTVLCPTTGPGVGLDRNYSVLLFHMFIQYRLELRCIPATLAFERSFISVSFLVTFQHRVGDATVAAGLADEILLRLMSFHVVFEVTFGSGKKFAPGIVAV